MASKKIALTTQRIESAACPPGKPQALIWDSVQPGLVLRVYRSGRKVFLAFYRVGSGRRAPQRWDQIGDADAISLKDARDAAKAKLGAVAKGGDPAGERRAEIKRQRDRLEPALDAYEKDLARRKVVKRGEVMSLLRRELLGPLKNVDLAGLTRNDLVKRIAEVETSGRPGTAKELRKVAAVFLGWCADHGKINASPLAGWRRQRRTRAERLERPGRALADWEIPIWWRATAASVRSGNEPIGYYLVSPRAAADYWIGGPFEAYLKCLLLLGQRRTETALMRWADLDLKGRVWTVPAEITKSGRAHRVPLPARAVAIIKQSPMRYGISGLVFTGRGDRPLTGWSKRLPPVYERTAQAGMEPWTPHDLRRTMRTGLGRLGVDRVVAELLLNHAISDELQAVYDRAEYWQQRVEAADRWANHVMGLIEAAEKVVPLRSVPSRT